MDIQITFSDIRNCFLDIQNNYFGYPKNGINVNSACHIHKSIKAAFILRADRRIWPHRFAPLRNQCERLLMQCRLIYVLDSRVDLNI